MAGSLRHRGPDGSGSWVDGEAGIALGHQRLAVIDLSSSGAQPMVSADGRIVLVYNGELYNYRELRCALDGARSPPWRSQSDSEVLVEAIAAWGVERALERANGMFAFAAWHRTERWLALARDRLGIKPLYWARFGEIFVFGSELRALRAHPAWRATLDPTAIARFLRYSNVPAPASIFAGVYKLEPGTLLTINSSGEVRSHRYWDPVRLCERDAGLRRATLGEAAERVENLLRDAVRRQMTADVPIGAFLSGGIDSSAVVAMMRQVQPGPVSSFTIGFAESSHDESAHARRIAQHLGTYHESLVVTPAEALAVIPRLTEIYDEPFADSSQIPAVLVATLARRHVKVVLSGDGGDEVFAGYNRHRLAALHSTLAMAPSLLRRAFAAALRAVPPTAWEGLAGLVLAHHCPPQLADKLTKLAAVLATATPIDAYRRLTGVGPLSTGEESFDAVAAALSAERDPVRLMQCLDLAWYLPNDVLTKVDRASMAVGLEVRVPMLDHRLVELVWSLPRRLLLHRGAGKRVLRLILARYVPPNLTARPKSGFAVPLGAWLRGPLRDWAEEFLATSRLRQIPSLDVAGARAAWAAHLTGRTNREHFLWNVLMLSTWLDRERRTQRSASSPAVGASAS